jgi:hypothetical protein
LLWLIYSDALEAHVDDSLDLRVVAAQYCVSTVDISDARLEVSTVAGWSTVSPGSSCCWQAVTDVVFHADERYDRDQSDQLSQLNFMEGFGDEILIISLLADLVICAIVIVFDLVTAVL